MKIDGLKRICEAATPTGIAANATANAVFIAAFNPVLVKKLLAVMEAAKAVRLKVGPMPPHACVGFGCACVLDQALAALEE